MEPFAFKAKIVYFEVVAPLLLCSWMLSIYSVFCSFCATAWLATIECLQTSWHLWYKLQAIFVVALSLQGISSSDTQQFPTTTYYYILGTYTYEYLHVHNFSQQWELIWPLGRQLSSLIFSSSVEFLHFLKFPQPEAKEQMFFLSPSIISVKLHSF